MSHCIIRLSFSFSDKETWAEQAMGGAQCRWVRRRVLHSQLLNEFQDGWSPCELFFVLWNSKTSSCEELPLPWYFKHALEGIGARRLPSLSWPFDSYEIGDDFRSFTNPLVNHLSSFDSRIVLCEDRLFVAESSPPEWLWLGCVWKNSSQLNLFSTLKNQKHPLGHFHCITEAESNHFHPSPHSPIAQKEAHRKTANSPPKRDPLAPHTDPTSYSSHPIPTFWAESTDEIRWVGLTSEADRFLFILRVSSPRPSSVSSSDDVIPNSNPLLFIRSPSSRGWLSLDSVTDLRST